MSGIALRTIREQVIDRIRDELVSGNFPHGAVLREVDLAKKYGVSRGPIRDAFLQLSNEGFLAYQANRGVTVRNPPDPEDRQFITSLRVQLETHVIRKGITSLTDESINLIKQALENLEAACKGDDVATVARCDMAFHQAILVACGGEDLVPAWRQLCARMLLTYTRLEDYGQAYLEHVRIFEAVRSKKKAATVAAIKANIK